MKRFALRIALMAYAALLIGPVGSLLPGNEWAMLVAGGGVGAVAGMVTTDVRDPTAFVSTAPRGIAGILVPLAWLGPAIVRAESVVSLFVSPWFVGALAVLVWIVALLLGHEIRQEQLQERLLPVATFEAGPPETVRRQTRYAVDVLLAATAVIVVGTAVLGDDVELTTYVWLPALLPVWLSLFSEQKQSVEITDEGVFAQGTLHEWETVDGYERDGDALRLTRTDWYRSTIQFDVEHIDDVDAVTDALDRYL
ncbi:DUF5673 domain-containing protein [Halapricum hydrolyticum]|uniref:DUF5673 domain-containing protein n=1 Tax=Halapricum hydrolyticum TaxID=2979991 RepID=A0AAE3LDX9_9EURY|nr:DUF5673 domain-containing protein [Halapricum hydrolyticum]MCU4716694.1 DUF5673 domain-containing protein [Halapricum hydrolyticum]MCU4725701.1 DUF5673 domain-containing protein [Halapricum hydrolyticum]